MSWLFPAEFGEEYRRQSQLVRLVALASSFLGLLFLVIHHASPFTLPVLLPVIWSGVDCTTLARQKTLPTPIRVLCDFFSAIFLAIDIPMMMIVGLFAMSLLTFVMGGFFIVATGAHGLLAFRAGVEFWRQSGLSGRISLPV